MTMRPFPSLFAALLLPALALSAPAQAAKRVALVIGNAVYAHAPQLANPLNDAGDIGAALGRLGFAVTKLENAGKVALERGLLHFSRAASTAETAVVFYAGHGIEVDKRNFLVPVDARLLSDREVEFETVPLDLVGRAVEGASGLGLVILDACRDNPFAASMRRAGAKRSIGRGLARVEPSGEMLVAYAAKEGTLASDGAGRNSPYTRALLAHLEEPGLEVGLMFRKVRDAVLKTTGNKQEPFVYGSLSSKGAYLGARPKPPAPTQAKPAVPPKGGGAAAHRLTAEQLAAERLFWESVRDRDRPADLRAYLDRYPQGTFAALARNRLKDLTDARNAFASEAAEAALNLTARDRKKVQTGLWVLGFDPGVPDGVFGDRTRKAIREWQEFRSRPATGFLDAASARTLRAAAPNHSGSIWQKLRNRPCKVWNQAPHPGSTATWTGGCVDSKASGSGRLVWRGSFGQDIYTGELRGGKYHGRGTYRWARGDRYEGEWREGKMHGHGIYTWPSGNRCEGMWREGKRPSC
ncbi:MAG: caspase family protein [Rhodospirillaceae bacterium]|nr:caspase family protein [Rhodospirillaceae bacterium]MDE0616398.1 caspase family protein [Rhodospirillaceae bacterium]